MGYTKDHYVCRACCAGKVTGCRVEVTLEAGHMQPTDCIMKLKSPNAKWIRRPEVKPCIHCNSSIRDIDNGIKFCSRCGRKLPGERE